MSDLYGPFVQILADELQETDPGAVAGIRRIVEMIGPKRAGELAELAKSIHDTTGMKTWREKRDRTIGGVFFALACRKRYSGMTTAQRKYCYPGIDRRANAQREQAKGTSSRSLVEADSPRDLGGGWWGYEDGAAYNPDADRIAKKHAHEP